LQTGSRLSNIAFDRLEITKLSTDTLSNTAFDRLEITKLSIEAGSLLASVYPAQPEASSASDAN